MALHHLPCMRVDTEEKPLTKTTSRLITLRQTRRMRIPAQWTHQRHHRVLPLPLHHHLHDTQHSPNHTQQVHYCQMSGTSVSTIHVTGLTKRLLKPLGGFGKLQESVPVLVYMV